MKRREKAFERFSATNDVDIEDYQPELLLPLIILPESLELFALPPFLNLAESLVFLPVFFASVYPASTRRLTCSRRLTPIRCLRLFLSACFVCACSVFLLFPCSQSRKRQLGRDWGQARGLGAAALQGSHTSLVRFPASPCCSDAFASLLILPACIGRRPPRLDINQIGVDGARALANVLPQCKMLQILKCVPWLAPPCAAAVHSTPSLTLPISWRLQP